MKLGLLVGAGCATAALFAASGASRPLGLSYESPTWSPDGSELVFGGARGPNGDVLIARANGKGVRRLARARFLSQVVVSPDGARVAFVTSGHVFVVGRDGKGKRRLGTGAVVVWSPDSSRLAFDGGWIGPIQIADARGGGIRAVTSGRYDRAPSWSPDGRELVFSRAASPGGAESLYVVAADGSNERPLGIQGADASWSPRGDRIAFWRKTADGVALALAKLDGSVAVQITRSLPAYSGPAHWSPDARTLLFAPCSATGFCRVDVGDAEGIDVATLASGAEPSWAPDGQRIAFTTRRGCPSSGVFTMDADGQRLRRITPCR